VKKTCKELCVDKDLKQKYSKPDKYSILWSPWGVLRLSHV